MTHKYTLVVLSILLLASCTSTTSEKPTTADSSTVASDTAAPPVVVVEQLWASDTLLTTCESVLFDKNKNILYVSNINGMPLDKDKNGFISKLTTDGKIEQLSWITGLDAPKGMAVFQNTLYVTDISRLVEIDIEKGEIRKTYEVPGAKFLNDVTVDTSGLVYFSDSETNKIHLLDKGKVSTWLDKGLKNPNGLRIESSRLLLASYGSNDFKSIDLATKQSTIIGTEIGAGDGIAYFGKDGHYVVSEWNGTVYLIEPNGEKNLVLDTKGDKTNSADIEFIPETSMLLVPTFFKNRVVAYKLTHNERP